MILKNQFKNRLILVLLNVLMVPYMSGCAGGPRVKVYYLDPERGLVREQEHEVITIQGAEGFFCLNPSDLETLLNACKGKRQ